MGVMPPSDAYCLGLQILGQCQYKFDPPSSLYFTIGNALTILSLIIALSQLLRPIVRFRLRVRGWFTYPTYASLIVALAGVFIATIIPQTPLKGAPVVGYPVFWELLSGLMVVFGSLAILFQTQRPPCLRTWNRHRFHDALIALINSGDNRDIKDLADDLRYSFHRLTLWSKIAECRQSRGTNHVPRTSLLAVRVLSALATKTFCQILVTAAPESLRRLFSSLHEQRLYAGSACLLVQGVIDAAMNDTNSLLYREGSNLPLDTDIEFITLFFGTPLFADSVLHPFAAWNYDADQNVVQARKIDKYAEALGLYVRTHCGDDGHTPIGLSGLKDALNLLYNISLSESAFVYKADEEQAHRSKAYLNLEAVERSFIGILQELSRPGIHIKCVPFDRVVYDRYGDSSILGLVATAIYDYFENLARVSSDATRDLIFPLWSSLFPESEGSANHNVWQIRVRIQELILRQLRNNVEQQTLPAVLRLMLILYGLPSGDESGIIGTDRFLHAELFDLVRRNFFTAWNTNKKQMIGMLPDSIQMDGQRVALIQNRGYGEVVFPLERRLWNSG